MKSERLNPWLVLKRGCFGLLGVVVAAQSCFAQNPELARTPPMGWNSWNHFHLEINEAVIRAQAAALVKSGMKDAGYQYVVIDGGWEGFHDDQGVFHPDPQKFTDMKTLCDYIHGLGLKVGIHTSPGPKTCKGREASYGHEKQDAATLARWGIDFVKYDWCSGDEVYKSDQMQSAYEKMHEALAATGRPMVYSLCQYGIQDVWKWGASVGGQMWRTTGDISDNYHQMLHIGFGQNGLEKYAGPGHWNDPDMLEIGNGGMKDEEYRTQMTLWCVLAAPLFAGNDLTQMSLTTLEILTNPEVIAIDQDAAGIQAHRAWQEGPREAWVKPLADQSWALAVFNRQTRPVSVTLDLGTLSLPAILQVRDLWLRKELGTFKQSLTVSVPRHGSVLLKGTPATAESPKDRKVPVPAER
jgi:alpha-galactosidase